MFWSSFDLDRAYAALAASGFELLIDRIEPKSRTIGRIDG
jgi:hypothetical protein